MYTTHCLELVSSIAISVHISAHFYSIVLLYLDFIFFYHFKTRIKLLQVTTRGILMCEICIASSHSFQQLHYR